MHPLHNIATASSSMSSQMTAFAVSWSHSSTPCSIMATLCLSDFMPISNDVYSPYSTPQLVWYFDFITTTTCLTLSRYCTNCVCWNGSTLNWRSWHTECLMVWRHRIWINSFRCQACQVVAIYSRCSCTSCHAICQQLANACFLSQPPFSGTLCQMMCRLQRLSLPSDIIVSPVISWHYSLNFHTTLSWTLQQFRLF